MIEKELNELGLKVEKLIELLQKVKLENNALRKKIIHLNNENIALSDKNKKAAQSIKGVIMRLGDELLCQTKK